jgi:hypothetical protein
LYVRTESRGRGLGSLLLEELRRQTTGRVLVGTWADAQWAIRFYEKHGFHLVSTDAKNRLLQKYWSIPARQVEESVVLAESDEIGTDDFPQIAAALNRKGDSAEIAIVPEEGEAAIADRQQLAAIASG